MLRLILCALIVLQAPSPQLQQQIRVWIEQSVVDDAPGSWPRRLMKERGLLLLHGNQAFLWYLSPEGQVFVLDTDRFGHRMEPETSLPAALNAVAQAARQHPELAEMLPARPEGAVDCPHCYGSGDEDQWGSCSCAGLGWTLDR